MIIIKLIAIIIYIIFIIIISYFLTWSRHYRLSKKRKHKYKSNFKDFIIIWKNQNIKLTDRKKWFSSIFRIPGYQTKKIMIQQNIIISNGITCLFSPVEYLKVCLFLLDKNKKLRRSLNE